MVSRSSLACAQNGGKDGHMRIAGWIRTIAALAVPWNAIGIMIFLSDIGVIAGGGPPPGGLEAPAAIKIAFGIGTMAAIAGSLGLLFLRKWSRALLWLSLVALVIDWGWVFAFSGAASIPIGAAVLCVAVLLAGCSEFACRRSLLV